MNNEVIVIEAEELDVYFGLMIIRKYDPIKKDIHEGQEVAVHFNNLWWNGIVAKTKPLVIDRF
jgi:hypothetical protein